MSTYLELCQDLREQLGISGTGPSSVTGQTGMMNRMVTNIKLADLFVQNLWIDWDFLSASHSATLATDSRTIAAPTGLQQWDPEALWLDAETSDAINLEYIYYKDFRNTYYTGIVETDIPAKFTIKPDGSLLLDVKAKTDYAFTGDYFKTPTPLAADGDVSAIPSQYEQIIIERAKIMYAQYTHDSGLFETASVGFSVCLKLLEQSQLPNHHGTMSEPESMVIIMQ